jgi:prephenate dehydrogenase
MLSFRETSLAIFGPGLLGGSLLLDARELGCRQLRVWARREESLTAVRERGLADFASTDARAVAEGADLLVLCVPVGGMKSLAEQIVTARLAPGALVTDVGSVKAAVLAGAGAVCAAAGIPFIGSHPMAGAETAGLEAARRQLYQGAACILTPEPDTAPEALARLEAFWQALGCRTALMDAARHDALVARISHLPHLAAVAATLASFQPDPAMAQFAAGGLRDTTRVASGPPGMWREILLENRNALLPALADLHRTTGELLEILQEADEERLLAVLTTAQQLRATRY